MKASQNLERWVQIRYGIEGVDIYDKEVNINKIREERTKLFLSQIL